MVTFPGAKITSSFSQKNNKASESPPTKQDFFVGKGPRGMMPYLANRCKMGKMRARERKRTYLKS